MLKTSLYYAAGGAAIVGGPAVGYDLMRRGRIASAENMHDRATRAERRALQEEMATEKLRVEAKHVGVDPAVVRRHLDELQGGAGTPALGDD